MSEVVIRPFSLKDIAKIEAVLEPETSRRLVDSRADWCWVAWQDDTAVAWATAVTLPGLDGVVELDGAVAPAYRRRGIGTAVLAAIIPQLRQAGITELSYALRESAPAAAHFFRAQGFTPEHEEWEMTLTDFNALPPPPTNDAALVYLPRATAIDTFISLYNRSFGPTAWYQPFSWSEVTGSLANSRDLHFLQCDGQLIGFAWLHAEGPGITRIEPVGLVPAWQGRGYGRGLLLLLLHELARQGGREVRVGVWRRNKTAVGLYEKLGFRRIATTIFLALNLSNV